MKRRTVLQAALAGATALALPHASRAQTVGKLSYLTWNIADQEQLFKEEFADFRSANPGVEIEWLDKKGPELPAFYQTQLVAGTPPDIVDIQGGIGSNARPRRAHGSHALSEEGAGGARLVQSRISRELGVSGQELHASLLCRQDACFTTTSRCSRRPASASAANLRRASELRQKMAPKGEKTGFLTLNFDWLYWPLFKMNGIDLLTPDMKKPASIRRRWPSPRQPRQGAAEGCDQQDRLDRTLGGAQRRFRRPALSACSTPIPPSYFFVKGAGVLDQRRARSASARRRVIGSTPNNHGFAISKSAKNPELAWAFINIVTGDANGPAVSRRAASSRPANVEADRAGFLEELARTIRWAPRCCGRRSSIPTSSPAIGHCPIDAQVKDAF